MFWVLIYLRIVFAEASKDTNDTLHFKVHDMRVPFEEKYDAIFNLFTSFGYFENEEDNLTTLIAIKESLSEYGFAVIDFLNVTKYYCSGRN
jgi:hypothetical protein